MSKASLSHSTGPGSSISLAPETIRIRDALIEKFCGAPLEDMTNFTAMALSNETDELRRLGILAARIYILRHRVANLQEFNRNPSLTSLPGLDTTTLSQNLTTASEGAITEDVNTTADTDQWSRIQMTEPGEVNGVRFLTGTIIDAQTQDAEKLIRSGKAIRVDEGGNIIGSDNDVLTNSEAHANDQTAEAVDDDQSASPESADDTDIEAPHGVNEDEAERESDQSQQADADEAPKAPNS